MNLSNRIWFRLFPVVLALPLIALVALYLMEKTEKKQIADFAVVYHPGYNITLMGLENLHPFDSEKYGHVFERLQAAGILKDGQRVFQPMEVSREQLLTVHTKEYLDSLSRSTTIAQYTELAPLGLLPNSMLDARVLRPMRMATAGTLLAARQALDKGLAFNLGGGYHHASREEGGGFCIYADISLAIHTLRESGAARRFMIVDLDAHQGNGPERDFKDDANVFIFDMYNELNYPADEEAKAGIDLEVALMPDTSDMEYLRQLKDRLPRAFEDFSADLVIYNAGTDIYENDPLGGLKVSRGGIVERDEYVLSEARRRGIPCVMLLSGGYTKESAAIIAESILNYLNGGRD